MLKAGFLSTVLFLLPAAGCLAEDLPSPQGKVLLSIEGKITVKNQNEQAVFDAAALSKLPQVDIRTQSPWYKGEHVFSGPTLASVLNRVGARGKSLRMKALNDYAVTVPFGDAEQFQPILARKVDGVALTVRDKGPLFLVYPYDSKTELQSDLYYSRSIWQLVAIMVE